MNLDLKSYVVRVENFSLVGKRSTTGLAVFLFSLQMPPPSTSREKDLYAAFVRRLKSYLRSTMTQERLNRIPVTSCHSETVIKLDSNQLYYLTNYPKAPSCTHECFLSP